MKGMLVLGLIAFCFLGGVKAQPLSTKILKIEIDGKEIKKNYKIKFLSNDKWIEAERTYTGFIIPAEVKNQEYPSVLITFGKYKLEFLRIHISKFTEDWIVGVDKKPFSDELISPERAKTVKRIYYIEFKGKGIGTYLVV